MSGSPIESTELAAWCLKDDGPDKVDRLKRVVRYTRRTSFIMELLVDDLAGLDERQVKKLVKMVCAQHSIKYAPPRGKSFTTASPRSLTSHQLFHASVLLGLLLNTRHGGLTRNMTKAELVDRLLYAYEYWLVLCSEEPDKAPVSLELFWFLYQTTAGQEIELHNCSHCGSAFISISVGTPRCPICSTLNLVRPSQSTPPKRARSGGTMVEKQLPTAVDRMLA